MQVFHGQYRSAIQVGPLIIKFPRLTHKLLQAVWPRFSLKRSFRKNLWFWWHDVRWAWMWIREAIRQNWNEYRCWCALRSSYLAPVYFSCGVMSIMRYERGEYPTYEEWRHIVQKLRDLIGRQYFCRIDPHEHFMTNVVCAERGYTFVDYGGSGSEFSMTDVFHQHDAAVRNILQSLSA